MIAPVTVAGILILTILAATVNAQESNSTGNGQESTNAGNATLTGVPENATSPSGSMENTTSGMESNNTGNAAESNSNMTEVAPSNMTTAAPNIGNARQESNNTGNATSPSGSTASNNTGNDSADFINAILKIHNDERAEFKLPPLVWNATAAAHAKAWVEYLGAGKAGGKMVHCIEVPGWEQIEACTHHEGENIAFSAPGSPAENQTKLAQVLTEVWVHEKPTGHYLQLVSRVTKSVGCGMITNGNLTALYNGESAILSCRYYPPGIDIPGCTENVPGCIARPELYTAASQQTNNTGNAAP